MHDHTGRKREDEQEQTTECATCPERADFETLCCKGEVLFEPGVIEYVPPADPYVTMAREFHQRMGLVVRDAPGLGTPAEREERVRLMLEELIELAEKLGVHVNHGWDRLFGVNQLRIRAVDEPDTASVLHELADLQVTVSGTAVQFGLPLLAATREVHAANMRKQPAGPGRKPLKPDGWKPADVSGLVVSRPVGDPRGAVSVHLPGQVHVVPAPTVVPTHRPRVIVESPYAGDVERNRAYLAAALRDCFQRGEAPFASHGLYTLPGVLDDTKPEERELGISAGFEFHGVADRFVVYTDLGLSSGMKLGIANAALLGVPVEYRTLPEWRACLVHSSGDCSDECKRRNGPTAEYF